MSRVHTKMGVPLSLPLKIIHFVPAQLFWKDCY